MSLSKIQLHVGASKCCKLPRELVCYHVAVPVTVCRKWVDSLEEIKSTGTKTSPAEFYREKINSFLLTKNLSLHPESHRVIERLIRGCPEKRKLLVKSKGRAHKEVEKKNLIVNFLLSDLLSIQNLSSQLQNTQHQLNSLNSENVKLLESLSNCQESAQSLEREIRVLRNELLDLQTKCKLQTKHIEEQEFEIQNLRETNAALVDYVEKIMETNKGILSPPKAGFSGVCRSYQNKILKSLKSRAEVAMWFMKSFGLEVTDINMRDKKGQNHTIVYEDHDVSENDKEKMKKILHLLDRFYISDAFYHELTMIVDGLPRTYLIKQLRSDMNVMCHVQRTPGEPEGTEIDVYDEVRFAIKSLQGKFPEADKYTVKFCGDGTDVSRTNGMVLMSFSLWPSDTEGFNSASHHTVAVVKGHENYDLYKTSFKNVFKSMNSLAASGCICIEDTEIQLNVCLGGDYKFLGIVLGLCSATSNHACIYCKVHTNHRGDISKPSDFYWGSDFVRSVEQMKQDALCSKMNFNGCKHPPLVKIPIMNIVIDELHLLLRITDRLLTNLIDDASDYDDKDKNHHGIRDASHLDELVKCMANCGVSFKIWKVIDKSGKKGGLDCSSLVGGERKKLLEKLPDSLLAGKALHPHSLPQVVEVWRKFSIVYSAIYHDYSDVSEVEQAGIFEKAHDWIQSFLEVAKYKRRGYTPSSITPYMHCLIYHVPMLAKVHLGLKKFSGQGMEKANANAKTVHLQHSNKKDSCASILKCALRQDKLADLKRQPREYVKKKPEWWEQEIFEKRRKCEGGDDTSESCSGENSVPDVKNMNVEELKAKLAELGVKTKVRNLEKLRQLLQKTLG